MSRKSPVKLSSAPLSGAYKRGPNGCNPSGGSSRKTIGTNELGMARRVRGTSSYQGDDNGVVAANYSSE